MPAGLRLVVAFRKMTFGGGKFLTYRLANPDEDPTLFVPASAIEHVEAGVVFTAENAKGPGCVVRTFGGNSYTIAAVLTEVTAALDASTGKEA